MQTVSRLVIILTQLVSQIQRMGMAMRCGQLLCTLLLFQGQLQVLLEAIQPACRLRRACAPPAFVEKESPKIEADGLGDGPHE